MIGIKERLDGTKAHYAIGRKRVKRKNYKKGHLRTTRYIAERCGELREKRRRAVETTPAMSKQRANELVQSVQKLLDFMSSEPKKVTFYSHYSAAEIELLFARGRRRYKLLHRNAKSAMPQIGVM